MEEYQLLVINCSAEITREGFSTPMVLLTDVLKFSSQLAAEKAYANLKENINSNAYDCRQVVKLY